jgi:hypothetical protein
MSHPLYSYKLMKCELVVIRSLRPSFSADKQDHNESWKKKRFDAMNALPVFNRACRNSKWKIQVCLFAIVDVVVSNVKAPMMNREVSIASANSVRIINC